MSRHAVAGLSVMILFALALLLGGCGGSASPPASQQSSTATRSPVHATFKLVKQQSQTIMAPANQPATATATCTSGEQLVSGGYYANVFEAVSVQASYPSGSNAWTVIASSPASFIELNAYAFCLQTNLPIQVTVAHATGSGTISATCPAGMVLTGGGWQQASNPVPSSNGWQVDDAESGEVYALCASNTYLSAAPAVSKTLTLPAGYGDGAGDAARCAAGQIASGGGFSGGTDIFNEGTDGSSWSIAGYSNSPSAQTVVIWAVCVHANAG